MRLFGVDIRIIQIVSIILGLLFFGIEFICNEANKLTMYDRLIYVNEINILKANIKELERELSNKYIDYQRVFK